MAKLSEKIKLTLDECRMLVLGTQVLISLQFELAFQSGFDDAPQIVQHMVIVGLGLLLATFALLVWGPAYHRIALGGEVLLEAQSFMTWVICTALWPLAAAMGLDAFIASDRLCGRPAGIEFGAIVFAFCAFAWYGFGMIARGSRPPEVIRAMNDRSNQDEGSGALHDQVNQVLTEARVVLPGAQAMLGFQFITFFERAFEPLPQYVKFVHLACAGMIALAVVLLMMPAAFHRLAEAGEESQRLVTVASWCVIAAMVPLATGMSGDFFVVAMKITHSARLGIALAGVTFAVFMSLWFGYTLYRRGQRHAPQHVHGALVPSD